MERAAMGSNQRSRNSRQSTTAGSMVRGLWNPLLSTSVSSKPCPLTALPLAGRWHIVSAHHTWRSRGRRRRGRLAAASAEVMYERAGGVVVVKKACLLAVISVEIPPVILVLGASAIRVDSVRIVGACDALSLHKTAGPVRNGPRVRACIACIFVRVRSELASC
eukprot:scaffold98436_cov66-Phaeocystis_antarctica.AAC.1